MTTNYKSVLALIAAAAACANLSQAGEGAAARPGGRSYSGGFGSSPAGEGDQSRGGDGIDDSWHTNASRAAKGGQPRQFLDLVTGDAALEAWSAIGPPQAEIAIDSASLNEVALDFAKLFENQFDVILPPNDPAPAPITLQMRLKDVRAIEVFNAMNLYFQAQKLEARWTLTLNGTRPTAILTVLPPSKPPVAPTPPPATEKIAPTVFSIVEILSLNSAAGDKQPTDSLADAIAAVLDDLQKPGRAKVNAPGGPILKMHAQAGILVFSGTWEETELVRSTLAALKDTAISRSNKARELELRAKDEAAHKAEEDARNKALPPPPPKGDGGAALENRALDDARNAALAD